MQNSVTKDEKQILKENPILEEIRKLPGVMRIDLEYYTIMGSKKPPNPVFVVVANSNFRDRPKVPLNVENIRVIMSYEEEVPKEEIKQLEEKDEGDADSSSDESEGEGDGENKDKMEVEGK